MSEFLDVIHYAFEIDSVPEEEEKAKARTRVRRVIYDMYGVELYTWGVQPDTYDFGEDISDPLAPAANKTTRKPYVPPTPMTNDPSRPYAGLEPPVG
jgi:hypothetical protein